MFPERIGAQILVTDDGVNGQRIWSINDAGIPTLLVESVNPGLDDTGSALDPGPLGLISSNSADVTATSLYTIYSEALGQQLWATDGTPAGTRLVLNLDPGLGTRNQEFSFSQPNNAVFVTDDGVHGQKLWFTDGTTGGTALLTTVDTGVEPTGSEFDPAGIGYTFTSGQFTAPYLFVLCDQTLGQQLWTSDGTIAGTHVVSNLQVGPGMQSVASFSATVVTGSAPADWRDVFVTDDGVHGQQIWSTNGTSAGTELLATVDPGAEPSGGALDPQALAPSIEGASFAAGDAAFVLYSATLGQQLWKSDGATASLVLTLDSGPGNKNSSTLSFSVNGDSVCATDDGVHGQKIWASDGTTAGTTLVATANSGTEAAGSEFVPSDIGFTGSGDGLIVLYDQTIGQELWLTDGTVGGTHVVANLEGAPGVKSYATQGLTLASGAQVFAIDDGVHGQQIWTTDGTSGAAPGCWRAFGPSLIRPDLIMIRFFWAMPRLTALSICHAFRSLWKMDKSFG